MGLCVSRKPGEGVATALPPVDPAQIEKGRTPVYLHIYDLLVMNYNAESIGLGVYHTGVQIYEDEYCFSGHNQVDAESGREITGLRCFRPPTDTSWIEDAVYKESVIVGYSDMSEEDVEDLFDEMKSEFVGASYNVLSRNCNHFSARFIERLLRMHEGTAELLMPTYVSRVVRAAQKVRPCLPALLTADLRVQLAPTVVGRGSAAGEAQPGYGPWSAGSVSEGGQSASGSQTARDFRQPLVGTVGKKPGVGGVRSRKELAAEERKRVQAKLLKQQQALQHSLARLQKQHNGAEAGAGDASSSSLSSAIPAPSPLASNNGSSTFRGSARASAAGGSRSDDESSDDDSRSSTDDDDGAESSEPDATEEGDQPQLLPSPPKSRASGSAAGAAKRRSGASGSQTARPAYREDDAEEESSLGSYVPFNPSTAAALAYRQSISAGEAPLSSRVHHGSLERPLGSHDGSESARSRRPHDLYGGSQTARVHPQGQSASEMRRTEEARRRALLEKERDKLWITPAPARTAAQVAAERFHGAPQRDHGQMSAAALAVSQLTRASISHSHRPSVSMAAGASVGVGSAAATPLISPMLLAATAAGGGGGGGSRRVSLSQAGVAPPLPPERQSNSRRGSLSGLPGGLPMAAAPTGPPHSGSLSHRPSFAAGTIGGPLSVSAASGSATARDLTAAQRLAAGAALAASQQPYLIGGASNGPMTPRGGPTRTAAGVPLKQPASGSQTARARF